MYWNIKICECFHRNRSELMKAYVVNLISALHYAKKLTEILLGRIAITSDHGEALGDPLNKLIPNTCLLALTKKLYPFLNAGSLPHNS